MKKYFGPNLPPISQLEKRATLALVNSDPILDHQGPMLNNVIAIGGMHVKVPKPLPQVNLIFVLISISTFHSRYFISFHLIFIKILNPGLGSIS